MICSDDLQRYARMLLRTGLDLEKGQELVINATLESAPLVRVLTAMGYEMGAKEVHINWSDPECDRARYLGQDEEELGRFPDWKAEMYNGYARRGCAYLRIYSENPDAFAGVDAARMALARNAMSQATQEASLCRMTGISPWLAAAYPSAGWAKKVFPGLEQQEAEDRLWQAILRATRADLPDPDAAWRQHQSDLGRRIEWLNAQRFVSMHYQSGLGTDFTVGLPKGHVWAGGGSTLKNGRGFIPNMPTEEIFSSPHRLQAEGTLAASMPLSAGGALIEDFRFTFREGRVTDFDAKRGKEALQAILDTDEGARYLGEIALVPADSPLNRMGLLFYNTLFDENSSCHFALGRAYPDCLEGGGEKTQEELMRAGLNHSLTHVDFMVGTQDLSITGLRADGRRVRVFEKGVWAEEAQG